MGGDLFKDLLSSGVVVAVVMAMVQLVLRLIDGKAKRRETADQAAAARALAADDDDDARRAREYAAFEVLQESYASHVTWDYEVLNERAFLVRLLHQAQTRLGETPTPFPPFRQPPSLRPPPKILPPPA